MGESRNMDSVLRIKEINAARKELGEDPFLAGDWAIEESFRYGLCTSLVRNDPDYEKKLESAKRRRAELAEKRREEEAAKQKAEEAERQAEELRKRPAINAYRAAIKNMSKPL